MNTDLNKYLPLTESTYYTMLTLLEPEHGYAIMQKVSLTSKGTVNLGPGTLYGILAMLEKEELIVKVKEEERRKSYRLTQRGKEVLARQIDRLEIMKANGQLIKKLL